VVLELLVAVPAEEVALAAGVLEVPVAAGPVVDQAALVLAVVPEEPVAVVAAVGLLLVCCWFAVGLLPQQLLLA